MQSDPRKKALELARKRREQRKKLLEKQKTEEKRKKKANNTQKQVANRQEAYLEKVRKEEEEKRQRERDKLQKTMSDLKGKIAKQKEIEETKQKREYEEKSRLEKERKEQEKRKEEERERIETERKKLHKLKEEEEKLKLRKKRENELLNKKETREEVKQATFISNSEKIKKKRKLNPNNLKNESSIQISRKNQRKVENLRSSLNIPHINKKNTNLLLDIKTLNNDKVFSEKKITQKNSKNPHARLEFEEKYLTDHKINFNEFSEQTTLKILWNEPLTKNKQEQNGNGKEKSEKTFTETLLIEIERERYYWLPFLEYDKFYVVLSALNSKHSISKPSELQVISNLTIQEIKMGLIDGLHSKLIIPLGKKDGKRRSALSQSIFDKSIWQDYQEIQSFQASNDLEQKLESFDKTITQIFLEKTYIKEFLYGLTQKNSSYPIKSRIFDKVIEEKYPKIKTQIINEGVENLINFGKTMNLIRGSPLKPYRNGKSEYITGTKLLESYYKHLMNKQGTLHHVRTNLSKTPAYSIDSTCPICSYPLHTSFKICPNCNYVLNRKCVVCGNVIRDTWKQCPYCTQTNRYYVKIKK